MARVAGATGTLSVARAAFDQALLLSGRRPRSRRPLGSGIVVGGHRGREQRAGVDDGRWERGGGRVVPGRGRALAGPRIDGLARSRARHARGGAPSLGRPATGRVGAHPGAEGAGSARDAGRESRCDPRADRFRREDRPLAELGADGARVAVLVGHDVDPFEADVPKQSFHRRGLVASQLQQEPTVGLQPTCASAGPPPPGGPCRRRRRRARAEVRTPGRRAGASGASPSARTARRPSARRRGARARAAADRPGSPRTPRRRSVGRIAPRPRRARSPGPEPRARPRSSRPRSRRRPCRDPRPRRPAGGASRPVAPTARSGCAARRRPVRRTG